jgi:hypothetical protein
MSEAQKSVTGPAVRCSVAYRPSTLKTKHAQRIKGLSSGNPGPDEEIQER